MSNRIIAARLISTALLCRVALSSCMFLMLTAFPATSGLASEGNRLPGLSGYWRLKDKGSAEPILTQWAETEQNKPDRKGDVELESELWCVFQGMPYVMGSAGNIEIRQSFDETIILGERLAVPRHIYFQLQERPSPDIFDFTPVGFSMGRLVGDTLVVETDMFTDGIGAEGAPRTENSTLVERFNISDQGRVLTITTSWTDSDVFEEPYVYTWTYERLPEGHTVSFQYCDPRANGVGNYPPGEDPRSDESKNDHGS